MPNEFFKGWAIPGPQIPDIVNASGELAPGAGETLDALSGHYRIFQLRDGHRFSTDDLLTAWYGTLSCPSASRVLDLGSGIGSVGMIAAWRLQGARFVTIEAQSESVKLARKSAKMNGIENRYEIRESDFRSPDILKSEEKFDLILGSPPYFPIGSGVQSAHPQKDACRFELLGTVADYCEVAAKHLARGGVFACVFPASPAEQRKRVEDAARDFGLQVIRAREIILREGEPPLLGVFAMMKSEDLPERARKLSFREPPLLIRRKDGGIDPEYSLVKLSIGFPP